MGEYTKLASDIIKNVGGKDNVAELRHCITRLRFTLKDESKAKDDVIKNMDGVVTVMKAAGQYMVVIGEHVPVVYKEVMGQLGWDTGAAPKTEEAPKKSMLNTIIGYVSGALGPCLGILCAAGIIKGITTLCTLCGLPTTSGIYMLLNAAGDGFFYFLPLFLGYNAGKKFGIDPFTGMMLAAAMTYPTIQSVPVEVFGFAVTAKYQGQFFPILVAVALAAPIYKKLNKVVPNIVKTFVVPAATVLIVFPIAFLIIGPIVNTVAGWIPMAINAIMNVAPVLTLALVGGFWQLFVLFGVHGSVMIVEFTNLMQGNPSIMFAAVLLVSFAQTGAVAAILMKTKDEKLKQVALPAFVSGLFGVTEPAIYGVTLPRIKMFVISCIGGAIGGAIAGLLHLTVYFYSGTGFLGLLGYINPENPQIIPVLIATVAAFAVPFALAYIMYKDDETADKKEISANGKNAKTEVIAAPLSGEVKALSEAKDDAFAMGGLGKGVVINPKEGKVFAPFDGSIGALFPTKHAIGIVSKEGCEVMVHVGLNTVNLDGKYYTAHVAQGDSVKKGQLLISFDKEAIEKEGFSLETPVVITNSDDYLDILEVAKNNVKHGEDLLTVLV